MYTPSSRSCPHPVSVAEATRTQAAATILVLKLALKRFDIGRPLLSYDSVAAPSPFVRWDD
ncbi:hypothetical protein GCM10018787_36200 [Streptomyces thermodiastaticus]|nr:hypothetical protein GCM10018787_36200 [Streptomyces thermodiastaticus]